MKTLALLAIGMAGCTVLSQFALAQGTQRVGRPPVRSYNQPILSPYLNLVGAGSGGEFERQLFLRTLPELQLRNAATELNKSVKDLRRDVTQQQQQGQASQLGTTGHKTAFQNYGGYFRQSSRR